MTEYSLSPLGGHVSEKNKATEKNHSEVGGLAQEVRRQPEECRARGYMQEQKTEGFISPGETKKKSWLQFSREWVWWWKKGE